MSVPSDRRRRDRDYDDRIVEEPRKPSSRSHSSTSTSTYTPSKASLSRESRDRDRDLESDRGTRDRNRDRDQDPDREGGSSGHHRSHHSSSSNDRERDREVSHHRSRAETSGARDREPNIWEKMMDTLGPLGDIIEDNKGAIMAGVAAVGGMAVFWRLQKSWRRDENDKGIWEWILSTAQDLLQNLKKGIERMGTAERLELTTALMIVIPVAWQSFIDWRASSTDRKRRVELLDVWKDNWEQQSRTKKAAVYSMGGLLALSAYRGWQADQEKKKAGGASRKAITNDDRGDRDYR
ncbi:hypothetical protein B0H63DRAFT_558436 [Podospora didyma]|uniref:Uncharacterized protein n=1 Tax=Podospora didyma TaxID=330526 RepID=A0AAE0NSE4_9PEZI|nr:hypothetical protein B0H63DRAFT_558436 [Podospora didyma]